jgi:4-hydroxybenzoate polyprenyltransferase
MTGHRSNNPCAIAILTDRSAVPKIKRAYLELLRPANVMTAVADGLAGFAAAGRGNPEALPWLLAATACLYAGGVALNDFFDRELDLLERPERPIPSGRVRPAAAGLLGAALLASGILAATRVGTAPGCIAFAIAVFVVLYDSWGKHRMFLGPVNMGLCRGLNLLLGMSAAPEAIASRWYLALLPFVYISAITALSRGEVHGGKRPVAVFSVISLTLLLIALLVLALSPASRSLWAVALTLIFAWRILPPFLQALQDSTPLHIRSAVRTGVLSLVLLDAVIGAAFAGVLYSLLILATAILAVGLARLFAVT